MKFRAHDTFFIRKGWLYKGMKNVNNDKYVFMNVNGNPMDILGIGANMVKSLRYWLQAVGLTEEPSSGKRYQSFTDFGDIIFEHDRYIEEMGTLWLLHYKLATNINDATAWYFFYNEFKQRDFTRDEFVMQLDNFIRMNGEDEKAHRILTDDFNCIINTYVPRLKSNPEKVQPENNIDCPLGELNLIDIVNKKTKTYKKCTPKIDSIHPLIALAIIVDNAKESNEIKISSILNDKGNLCKVFNLDVITLTTLLNKIELMGYIKVIRTAGLDVIRLENNIQGDKAEDRFKWCVKEYYNTINA
ncbi:DUF4007 family protein [Paludicola sp. MB14-C6]|uniref:DUF4007 family protein n=1 Tax=Paludihabitans sp. MB14-C6 TaxID=3070656 RepID=UPI0027DAE707|nr:DUF4007 family protein [Paludicola sp. MB14-C6]WMJ22911.1 DUF4007 family protein [Paludicola sp. MB14-C6]